MPATATLLTDANSLVTNGQTAATATAAQAAAGPIQDVIGNLVLIQTKVKELKQLYTALNAVVDAGDPNKTLIANALLTLV